MRYYWKRRRFWRAALVRSVRSPGLLGAESANIGRAFATALIARITKKTRSPRSPRPRIRTSASHSSSRSARSTTRSSTGRARSCSARRSSSRTSCAAVFIVSDYDNFVAAKVERGIPHALVRREAPRTARRRPCGRRRDRERHSRRGRGRACRFAQRSVARASARRHAGRLAQRCTRARPACFRGLSHLASVGAIEADDRIGAWACELPARYRAAPDTGSRVPSYLLGEAGVLSRAALRARPRAEWFDDLLAAVANSNVGNPTLETLWGAPARCSRRCSRPT